MWVYQPYLCLRYCFCKKSWQLISIDNLSPFKQTCPALGRQDRLLFQGWTKLRGDKSLCFMAWGSSYCQDNFFPALRNVSTQNVRPIVMVLNYGHIYLGMMVRFSLFVLSTSFAYIFFAKLSLLSILIKYYTMFFNRDSRWQLCLRGSRLKVACQLLAYDQDILHCTLMHSGFLKAMNA